MLNTNSFVGDTRSTQDESGCGDLREEEDCEEKYTAKDFDAENVDNKDGILTADEDDATMEDSDLATDGASSQDGSSPAKKSKSHGSSPKGKKGKSKQKKMVPGMSTYQAHKASAYKATSTGSLLEEVLNEKKMVLLKSPEVIHFLQGLQQGVQQEKQATRQHEGHYNMPYTRPHTADMRLKSERKDDMEHHVGGTQGDVHPRREEAHVKKEVHFDLSSLPGQEKEIKKEVTFDLTPSLANQSDSNRVIWSKDASAFSSVSGSNENG